MTADRSLLGWAREQATCWDRGTVTRADTDRLAAGGWYAAYGPAELGGASAAGQRDLAELLAGASPDLWFVWFQHGPVVRMLTGQPEHAPLLAELCSGRVQAGVAFSHLRSGRPTVTATRTTGGWRLSGTQPWCTGWGIADVYLVGAVAPDGGPEGEALLGLVRADAPGWRSTGALELAAMRGTATHAVTLDEVLLLDEALVARRPYPQWLAADRAVSSNVQPSTFGVATAALELVPDPGPLADRLAALRAAAYRLLDEVPYDEQVDERLALRSQALLLALTCCAAAVTARGGRAIGLADPAQLLLRSAGFHLVHAQGPHSRAAALAATGAWAPPVPTAGAAPQG